MILIGTVLLCAALSLLGYNQWEDYEAGQTVAGIADRLEVQVENNTSPLVTFGGTIGTSSGSEEAVTYQMDTIEIDGYEYIGTLSIPSFGLELPVQSQWSYAGLKIAPGRYTGSVYSNDLVICAHNYTRHFGNLKYLESGAEVVFTDVNGIQYTYQVVEVITLSPNAVIEMTSGSWDLTLFTCTIGGRSRVTVRCERVD